MHVERPAALASVLLVVAVVAACAPQASPSIAPVTPGPTLAPSAVTAIPSESPAPSPGFAFDAESVVGYYASIGYACGAAVPSTKAVDFAFRSCEWVDLDGRTRVVGITTDPAGDIADAFTSLTGTATETVLEPSAALEPFAAFLGAVLGETQGEALLEWLAGHIGDDDARTALGELVIATYSESSADHSRIYLEIANQAYLESPTPSGSAPAP